MVRSVICETYLEEYLKSLSKKQGTSVGLLIGQPSNHGKDHIIYLNKIKEDDGPDQENKGLLDIENQHVSQHALVETRILPGGFYVMGIFVIYPKSVFEDSDLLRKVKTMLVDIRHTFDSNVLIQGNCDELDGGEKLVFYYSSSSNIFGCKSIALKSDNLSVKPCDWKFQDRATSWHVMSTYFETDEVFVLKKKTEDQYDTEANLTNCVENVRQQLEKSVVFFDGGPIEGTQSLEHVIKAKKNDQFLVHVYSPSHSQQDISTRKIVNFAGTMQFEGVVSSKVFVHPKNTIAEVERFVKVDILRSLMSRVQIHCDSLVLAEDPVQDTIMLNELPRRIYFPIRPKSNPILFSEYLFREESKETAIPHIRETLDLSVTLKELNATVETVPEIKEEEQHDAKECETGGARKGAERPNVIVLGTLSAIVVLIVAIIAFYVTK
ncbi:protein odr-4 homolog [Malaya genurostris]|uniref:protein odr-4 homolog n=1 Tax=Malaya genurostris TaxID=325434 RepID=UPI0026F399CF|nr:protein odr-4 homolog [Malaya genurostris]